MNKVWILLSIAASLLAGASSAIADCAYVDCATGFQCVEGVCVRQKTNAKKKLCTLNWDLSPIKCTNRNYECLDVDNVPSCGFSSSGDKISFINDCLPCLDSYISFYYKVPCDQAPSVCSEDEECVNGKCLALFSGSQYDGNVRCQSNSDCRPIIELCVSGKCVKLTETVNVLQRANIPAPPLP